MAGEAGETLKRAFDRPKLWMLAGAVAGAFIVLGITDYFKAKEVAPPA